MYEVVENTDEDRQTNSDETVLGVVAKTDCQYLNEIGPVPI